MRRADNLTTFICRLSWNLGAWSSWNPQGLSRPVIGLLYLLNFVVHLFLPCGLFLFPNQLFILFLVSHRVTLLSNATLGNVTQCFLTLLFVSCVQISSPSLFSFKEASFTAHRRSYVAHMLSELRISSHWFCIHLSVLHFFFAGYISYELLLLKEGY